MVPSQQAETGHANDADDDRALERALRRMAALDPDVRTTQISRLMVAKHLQQGFPASLGLWRILP